MTRRARPPSEPGEAVDGAPDGFVESAEIQAGLDPDLRTDEQVRDDEDEEALR